MAPAAIDPRNTAPTDTAMIRISMSDLDLDDPGEPEPTDDRQDCATDDADDPDRLLEEQVHVARLQHEQHQCEGGREDAEDDGRHAALGGERLDLATQTFAVRHRLRDRVEELGEVSTDFPLDP